MVSLKTPFKEWIIKIQSNLKKSLIYLKQVVDGTQQVIDGTL